MIISKLTSKAQTTLPQAVRLALGVSPGDEIAYEIGEHSVVLTKAPAKKPPANPIDNPFATFWEWSTPEDDAAFADL